MQKHPRMHITIHTRGREPASDEATQIFLHDVLRQRVFRLKSGGDEAEDKQPLILLLVYAVFVFAAVMTHASPETGLQ